MFETKFYFILLILLKLYILILSQTPTLPKKENRYFTNGTIRKTNSLTYKPFCINQLDTTNGISVIECKNYPLNSIQRSKSLPSSFPNFADKQRKSISNLISSDSLALNDANFIETQSKLGKFVEKQGVFGYLIWKSVWINFDFVSLFKDNCALFKSKVVTEINLYRKYHNVLPLEIDGSFNILAEIHIQSYMDENKCETSKYTPYAEICQAIPVSSATILINYWYSGFSKYNFFLHIPKSSTQPFTQLVWKSSQQIGIAARIKNNILYIIFIFFPRGNIKGKYRANVMKRKFTSKN
ncbi:CAP domain-containing protein [Strongyloides ratti]|uniref:CAP domain-containing protein n=1 Tax=Strongyloides ratti TaxID=34506 RepID=A0A090LEY7_STRRB|nr:CAP domain-containing protein [Strongyloides ratti]CEF66095.1 CAP domain-containing protein [Strongyloides ratti]